MIKGIFRARSSTLESVDVDGLEQIVFLSVKHPAHLEKHYGPDVANLRSALGVKERGQEELEITGMRIALTTQLSNDAQALRKDVQTNLVLTALSDGKPHTVEALAKKVSDALHLPRRIQTEYFQSALGMLEEQKLVTKLNEVYILAPNGLTEVKSRTESGSKQLIEGQQVIRTVITALTGQQPDSTQFAKLWNALQDELARLFLANGIYITDSIASIASGTSSVRDHPNLRDGIRGVGDHIAALGIWGGRDKEISQAIVDLMQDGSSAAFEWLTQLCAVYVSVCSLGLEKNAQEQMAARLREIDLIMDTDVVLSLLSPGEPQHTATEEVVKGWMRLSGRVFVSASELEEAAYHAWISEREFHDVWRDLATMSDEGALRLLDNVFVRGFRVESKSKIDPGTWRHYIGMFRGSSQYDYQKVLAILSDRGIGLLDETIGDKALSSRVADLLIKMNIETESELSYPSKETEDKCKRDGRLLALLVQHRVNRRQLGGNAIVVSSSGALRTAAHRIRGELGPPEPVLPIGAVAYLLATTPGVNMNLTALRAILFDVGVSQRLAPLERAALRILSASTQYFLPFSRRATLRVRMREEIAGLAKQLGRKASEVADDLVKNKDEATKYMPGIVAAAMDKIVESASERKIRELEDNIKILKGKKNE